MFIFDIVSSPKGKIPKTLNLLGKTDEFSKGIRTFVTFVSNERSTKLNLKLEASIAYSPSISPISSNNIVWSLNVFENLALELNLKRLNKSDISKFIVVEFKS